MSTLPEVFKKAYTIEEAVIALGGELPPELDAYREEILNELATKGASYGSVVDRLGNTVEYYKSKRDEFDRIAKGLERTREFLKDALLKTMIALGHDELSTPDMRIKLQKSPPRLDITEEALIPSNMKKVVYSPDRELIKQAIESGEVVPGAQVTRGVHLRFYAGRSQK